MATIPLPAWNRPCNFGFTQGWRSSRISCKDSAGFLLSRRQGFAFNFAISPSLVSTLSLGHCCVQARFCYRCASRDGLSSWLVGNQRMYLVSDILSNQCIVDFYDSQQWLLFVFMVLVYLLWYTWSMYWYLYTITSYIFMGNYLSVVPANHHVVPWNS